MEGLINQLVRHEGLKLKPYRCPAGKLTIGVGRNLEDIGITKEEAMVLLRNDVSRCMAECRDEFFFFDNLSEVRQNVLINMCFNLGINRLKEFRNMIVALAKGDYEQASKEMLDSKWAKQVGNRAIELAKQMKEGK